MNRHRRTYVAKPSDTLSQRAWWVVDAQGKPLGRVASAIATRLRGKHKTVFTPHADAGDFVVVINAAKVVLTGDKLNQKHYFRHSGYPGGYHMLSYGKLMERRPELVVSRAVRGMLPKTRLGRKLLKKLKVYAGPEHPHTAQNPQPLTLDWRGKAQSVS